MIILSDTITKWPASRDMTGAIVFGTPVLIKGHWEDGQEQFVNRQGLEETSTAIAYLDTDSAINDWLAQGDHVTGTPVTDPQTLGTALEIKGWSKIPDLRHIVSERKAFL